MSTTGLVLKPLTPAEAARSRSLSGPARTRAPSSNQETQESKFRESSFIAEYMREQGVKELAASPFLDPTRGQATPGSGMLSSGMLFTLQENSPRNKQVTPPHRGPQSEQSSQASLNFDDLREAGTDSAAGGSISAAKLPFNPATPKALQAYGRARESVDRLRTAYAALMAAKEAKDRAQAAKTGAKATALIQSIEKQTPPVQQFQPVQNDWDYIAADPMPA